MKNGFTLIELMVVVAIISILAAVAIPNYQQHIKKTELSSALASLSALKINVEDQIITNGQFPTLSDNQAMSEQLGATETSLGQITTRQHASDRQAGQIIISLSGTQFNNTGGQANKLALERNAQGKWNCITDIAATEKSYFPKGCTHGAIF